MKTSITIAIKPLIRRSDSTCNRLYEKHWLSSMYDMWFYTAVKHGFCRRQKHTNLKLRKWWYEKEWRGSIRLIVLVTNIQKVKSGDNIFRDVEKK